MHAILEGIALRGLDVAMWIETRADMLTPELLRLLNQMAREPVPFRPLKERLQLQLL